MRGEGLRVLNQAHSVPSRPMRFPLSDLRRMLMFESEQEVLNWWVGNWLGQHVTSCDWGSCDHHVTWGHVTCDWGLCDHHVTGDHVTIM